MTNTICPSCGLGQHEPGLCLECLGCTECVIDVDTSRCLACGELDPSAEYERVLGMLTRALGEPVWAGGWPHWGGGGYSITLCDGKLDVYPIMGPSILTVTLNGSADTDLSIQQVIMRFKMRAK